jgi:hypothetical protein
MKFKPFLDFYTPVPASKYRLTTLPESSYIQLEELCGLMPGMEFDVTDVSEDGVQIVGAEDDAFERVFLGWLFIEPADEKEREQFKLAVFRYVEYLEAAKTAHLPKYVN